MKFEVILKKGVTRDLKKLGKTDQIRIFKALEKFGEPFSLDIKKLMNVENTYAARVGNFRIVFKIYFDKKIVFVTRIDKRERVYDHL